MTGHSVTPAVARVRLAASSGAPWWGCSGTSAADRVEHRAYPRDQHLRRERLGQKGPSAVEQAPALDLLAGKPAHEEHTERGVPRRQADGELATGHPGHHQVGDEHVDVARVLLRPGDRRLAVLGVEHGVAG